MQEIGKRKLLEEKGIMPEDIDSQGTDIEKKVAVIGTKEALVKEFIEDRVGCQERVKHEMNIMGRSIARSFLLLDRVETSSRVPGCLNPISSTNRMAMLHQPVKNMTATMM